MSAGVSVVTPCATASRLHVFVLWLVPRSQRTLNEIPSQGPCPQAHLEKKMLVEQI